MSRNESCMNILTDSLDTHVVHPCAGVNGYRGSIEFFRVETFLFHPCNRGLQITHSEFELLNVETDLGGIDMCRVFHELITVYDILVIVNIFSSEYVLVSNFRGSSSCFYFLVIPLYCLSAICDYIPYIFENGRIFYRHSFKKWFPPFRRWHFSESDFSSHVFGLQMLFLNFIQFIVVRKFGTHVPQCKYIF